MVIQKFCEKSEKGKIFRTEMGLKTLGLQGSSLRGGALLFAESQGCSLKLFARTTKLLKSGISEIILFRFI